MNSILLILNFNNSREVLQLVERVNTFNAFKSIVIVDNASTDDSCKLLTSKLKNSPNISLLFSETNLGYAGGNNIGLRFIEKKFLANDTVFISNPDVRFSEQTVLAMQDFLEQNPMVGVVTGKTASGKSAWKHMTWGKTIAWTSYGMLKLCREAMNTWKYYDFRTEEPHSVDVITGAFFASRVGTLTKVKNFDAHTFLYYEEDILSMKMKKRNYELYVLPNVNFSHIGGTTTAKNTNDIQKNHYFQQSAEYYYRVYLRWNFIQIFLSKVAFFSNDIIIYERRLRKLIRKSKGIK